MLTRGSSAKKTPNEALPGRPQLTLAKLIVFTEVALRCFARPLACAVLFVAIAWSGIFASLYPWAHLAALMFFIVLFFDAIGRAQILWQRPSLSFAKRRVEEASGLAHRPLDVLEDRPAFASEESHTLWQEHVLRARAQAKKLYWPRWKFDFAKQDPYGLRYALAAVLMFGLVTGWGALGGRLIAAINPALGRIPASTATIDAWITPPEYTHLPPIMIATPAGARYQDEIIKVPEGSVLHAHLAEKDGETPVLEANNQSTDFSAEDDKDFGVTQDLTGGSSVAIHRGWMTLGSWKVQVVPDRAPEIAFTETPSASERKDVRVAYDANDDYGVTSVTLRMTPRETLYGISPQPKDYEVATLDEKDVKRIDFKDLTAEVWAGSTVDLQLIATDAAGHKAESDKVAMVLPERIFLQPVARALIEERKKLLQNMLDMQARNEAANLMAGVARQPAAYGGDPVVMMALRAGAVRLVLDHEAEAVLSAKDILWQSALRIEDGVVGLAEQNLRQAQKDLADALDRNASEKEIQALIDRLHQALAQYLAQLSTRVAAHPDPAHDLNQVLGSRTNALTPQDLEKMLQDMKGLSASGSRDEARQELSKLQQILENLQTQPSQLSQEQLADLAALKALKELTHDQQELLDKTFQKAQNGEKDPAKKSQGNDKDSAKLADQQKALGVRLRDLMGQAKGGETLPQGADAMARAEKSLHASKLNAAVPDQNEALKALRQAEQAMTDNLRQNLFGLPGGQAMGQNNPFDRDGGNAFSGAMHKMRAPDRFEAQHVRDILDEIQRRAGDQTRPKVEREYIERLLQNF